MSYTINNLAKLSGVSIRTLHYYDEIGLLKPSGFFKNGYRYYERCELLRLQQILFYRELDFPLNDIKEILDKPGFNIKEALTSHERLVKAKRKKLDRLIKTIKETIKNMDNQKNMNDEELYDPFRDDDVKKYQTEAKFRWGKTDSYKQSMERIKKITKAEMEKMKEDGKRFTQKIADNMDKGIADSGVQALIAEHYKSIQLFYDCPLELYRNLGKMYVNDPRFSAYYNKFRPGLAIFMRDAIFFFCDKKE